MRGPVYEAYTHFGESTEEAITGQNVIRGAHFSRKGELTFEIDGNTHKLGLEYITRGSYNAVYGVRDTKIPLVLRVSIPSNDEDEEETDEDEEETDEDEESKKRKREETDDEDEGKKRKRREKQLEEKKRRAIRDQRTELQFMRRMGKSGIGPRVYATVLFTDPRVTGVFTEKLEMSLQDAESCPHLARRAFVDADAELALVDLYARSSRMFGCIDTKSPNVLFTPGHRGADARIAMIDMDPNFCTAAAHSSTAGPTPTTTTLNDLDTHLSRHSDSRDSRDSLDSACISLLIHCLFYMKDIQQGKDKETARGYGFPYPRVAACLYNNWRYVWQLVIGHRAIQKGGYTAAFMVAHYHYDKGDMKLERHDPGGLRIRSAIADAIRAPMTRILLMTKGLGVREGFTSDEIGIVPIGFSSMSGDMYVRLARVHDPAVRVDQGMIDAIAEDDYDEALEALALKRERGLTRFLCRASKKKRESACCHDPGNPFCDTASSVRVRYSDAVYREPKDPKWRHPVYVPSKRVDELDREQTAQFLCHQMRIVSKIGSEERYRVARNIFKLAQWTGEDLARMVKKPKTMANQLRGFGIPPDVAKRLVERTGEYIKGAKQLSLIEPCAD